MIDLIAVWYRTDQRLVDDAMGIVDSSRPVG